MSKTQEPGITKIEGARGTYYRVQIRIKNGEHLSKNFDNFKDAKDWKRKTIAALKAGDPYETTQMRRLTVRDLIDRFIENELKKLRNHKTCLAILTGSSKKSVTIALVVFGKMSLQNVAISSQAPPINMGDLDRQLPSTAIFAHWAVS